MRVRIIAAVAVIAALGIGIALGARLASRAGGAAPEWDVALAGPCAMSGGLAISSVNIRARAGKPAVVFGTFQTPKDAPRLSYVAIVRLPAAIGAGDFGWEGSADAAFTRGAKAEGKIALGGRELAFREEVDVRFDEKGKVVLAGERLSASGKGVDIAAGRVFLVDLAAEPAPAPRQVCAALPDPPERLDPAAIRTLGDALLEDLAEKDEAVRMFLGP